MAKLKRDRLEQAVFRPPDTIYLLIIAILSGIAQFLGRNKAVEQLVPLWIQIPWSIILVVGALVSLTGIFWTRQPKGVLIEEAGRWMLWPSSLAYAVAVLAYSRNTLSCLFIVGFSLICVIRILFIRRVLYRWVEFKKLELQMQVTKEK